jgi:AAA+ superfamily predicted ATPase
MDAPYGHDGQHLADRLRWLDLIVRRGIRRARAGRDGWGGLCVSDQGVDQLLAGSPSAGDPGGDDDHVDRLAIDALGAEIATRVGISLQAGVPLSMPRLTRLFNLSGFEEDVLLLCLAPAIDLKYQRLYGYLHDDATRRTPTVDLLLGLLCQTAGEKSLARQSFLPGARLLRYGLVEMPPEEPEPPLLARPVRIEAQLSEHLLGNRQVEPWLDGALRLIGPEEPAGSTDTPLATALQAYLSQPRRESWLAVLQGPDRAVRQHYAQTLCAGVGLPLLLVDVDLLAAERALPFELALRRAFREAALQSAAIYLEHDQALSDEGKLTARGRALERVLGEMAWITFLSGPCGWNPPEAIKRRWLFFQDFPLPGYLERQRLWDQALQGQAGSDVDTAELAAGFRFTPSGVANAVARARNQSRQRGAGEAPLARADLRTACRAESSGGLDRHARRVSSSYGWSDLVLPAEARQQLQEIVDFVRHREGICAGWGFGAKHTLGRGTNVLFSGASGTGKTMAAGIMAADVGLELYRIDLSTVVSKYIGETEKNLGRVFGAAEAANAVLFFDEADALFGRRSEVKDSHDRYANIEVNYLLQKMEEHEGIVVLATNMSKNMDEAFVRRLQFTVVFPFPEEAERLRIWRQVFPPQAPLEGDVRFDFLARRFKVAGGNIKNIALGAALLARAQGCPAIGMRHLVLAAKREYQKMGKICARSDFGDYYELVS